MGECLEAPQRVDQAVEQLLRHYQCGRQHLFVQQSHRLLSQLAHTPQLTKVVLRSLLEQGLGGPARELIQLRRDLDPADAEVRALLARVEQTPHGRVSWPERREVFERNAAVLAAKGGQLADAGRRLLKQLSSVHLFRTGDGSYQIARRRPGQLREWWLNLTAVAEEGPLDLPERGQLGPSVITGIVHGELMRRICERTENVFLTLSHPVFIVEPDEVRLAAWLHCDDHTSWLAQRRVLMFAGDGAIGDFEQALQTDPELPLPTHFISPSGEADRLKLLQSAVTRVGQQRNAELGRLVEQLQDRYRDRDRAYWARRWQSRGSVLALTSRFTTMLQYSTRDAMLALADQGYETHTLLEDDDHHQHYAATICRKLLEVDPDFILLLDHLPYEHPHIPRNLPFLTWIQDPLPNLLSRQAGESVGPFHFVAGYYRKRCIEEFGYPAERFVYLPIPVSAWMFRDDEPGRESIERYAADVCYVSNAAVPGHELHRRAIAEYPAGFHPTLTLIYERVRQLLDGHGFLREPELPEFVLSIVRETNLQLSPAQFEQVKNHYARKLFDWGWRHQTLEWVATWARRTNRVFRIYGRGWDTHPTLAEFAFGAVEHGEPLRCAYRASKLAVQAIPSGFVHQRTFETLAAGALPLVRYCPIDFCDMSIEDFRAAQRSGGGHRDQRRCLPDLGRIAFRTAEEFEALAEMFLDKPELYESTKTEFREAVRNNFTYEALLPDVVATMRDSICHADTPVPASRG